MKKNNTLQLFVALTCGFITNSLQSAQDQTSELGPVGYQGYETDSDGWEDTVQRKLVVIKSKPRYLDEETQTEREKSHGATQTDSDDVKPKNNEITLFSQAAKASVRGFVDGFFITSTTGLYIELIESSKITDRLEKIINYSSLAGYASSAWSLVTTLSRNEKIVKTAEYAGTALGGIGSIYGYRRLKGWNDLSYKNALMIAGWSLAVKGMKDLLNSSPASSNNPRNGQLALRGLEN